MTAKRTKLARSDRPPIYLVGAGVSMDWPSGIPAAQKIAETICRWIAGSDDHVADRLINRCTPGSGNTPFDFLRFESLVQGIAEANPEFPTYMRVLELHGQPNAYHLFLAEAILQGAHVLTTNFDNRIEEARMWLGEPGKAFVLGRRHRAPLERDRLIKLHGSFPLEGRRHLPVATLNRIGGIGFAFGRFSKFQSWFERTTHNRPLIVMGYSAMDSFDVVPLIEAFSRHSTLIWFDFTPNMKDVQWQEVKKGDPEVIPFHASSDFIGMVLTRCKGMRPKSRVWRVRAASLDEFLRDLSGAYVEIVNAHKDALRTLEHAVPDNPATLNIETFRELLAEDDFEPDMRAVLIEKLLENDAFGEHIVKPLERPEEKPSWRGINGEPVYQTVVELCNQREFPRTEDYLKHIESTVGSKQKWHPDLYHAKAYFLLETGLIEEAFQILEEGFRRSNDLTPMEERKQVETFLMFAEGEFSFSLSVGNLAGMRGARKKLRRRSLDSGTLWGLIVEHLCQVRECEFLLDRPCLSRKQHKRLLAKVINLAGGVAYFSLRTGRSYWYLKAVRSYAAFLARAG
ncbi:MAG: hypothetical protein HQL35_09295, partial [Alphaproteobacteria bacterium]|nr:hypothetical protein [Alphaproteobacteria bacterium]